MTKYVLNTYINLICSKCNSQNNFTRSAYPIANLEVKCGTCGHEGLFEKNTPHFGCNGYWICGEEFTVCSSCNTIKTIAYIDRPLTLETVT